MAYYTVVCTVQTPEDEPSDVTANALYQATVEALSPTGVLPYCDWAPDPDTIADQGLGCYFHELVVVDCNPPSPDAGPLRG